MLDGRCLIITLSSLQTLDKSQLWSFLWSFPVSLLSTPSHYQSCPPWPLTQGPSMLLKGKKKKKASPAQEHILWGCGRRPWWTTGSQETMLWFCLIKLAQDNDISWNGNTSINAVIIIKDTNGPLRINDRLNRPYAVNHKETLDRENLNQELWTGWIMHPAWSCTRGKGDGCWASG